jgi:hypothetical protein
MPEVAGNKRVGDCRRKKIDQEIRFTQQKNVEGAGMNPTLLEGS